MTTTDSSVKLTYADYVHFPDDGRRHELIEGDHHVTPSPNTRHQQIAFHLTSRDAELSREAGDVLQTPLLPGLSLPVADLFA